MKKCLLFFVLLQFMYLKGFSATGDTIKVKAHENVLIQTDPGVGQTFYPVWAEFPAAATKYYKVYANLTFQCPIGMTCGEWDYINDISIRRKGGKNGDTVGWEIARFITPYGLQFSSTWKHGWYYDMTDFAPLLHDSVEIVYRHSGYEAQNGRGWVVNLNFYCVEGTPPLPVNKIDTMWHGSFAYGSTTDPIENHLDLRNVTLEPGTKAVDLKIIQTGHGMDAPSNCVEFCPKQRTIKFDGSQAEKKYIWRECGFNSLFPQAGTWLYDRTNWCPGESVREDNLLFKGLAGGSTHSFDFDMDPYTSNSNTGNWVISSYLAQYNEPTYTNDASLEAVIAPSKEYEFLRYNPICGKPIIVIRNNGKNNLKSAEINYGLKGAAKATFNWVGDLALGQNDTVELTTPMAWQGGGNEFEVEVTKPNGAADEFIYTDRTVVPFNATDVINDNKVVITFKSNKAATENYYRLRDAVTGNIVYEKNNFANSTVYRDTVMLTPGQCYAFEFFDDGPSPSTVPDLNKDGLNWWANAADGSGYIRLQTSTGSIFKNFNADFGTKILYQFTAMFPVSVGDVAPKATRVDVYPNPSNGEFAIDYELQSQHSNVDVYSITGAKVYSQALSSYSGSFSIDLSSQAKGIYMIKITSADKAAVLRKVVLQ
ncbi:MAG: T9SS type A sorting domain-containing protein [Sphingobacteriales bacterium]|nr:MAG: T9SS type A sorting domain-containing protein [Sphingobacteriales bacterium]